MVSHRHEPSGGLHRPQGPNPGTDVPAPEVEAHHYSPRRGDLFHDLGRDVTEGTLDGAGAGDQIGQRHVLPVDGNGVGVNRSERGPSPVVRADRLGPQSHEAVEEVGHRMQVRLRERGPRPGVRVRRGRSVGWLWHCRRFSPGNETATIRASG